MPKGNRRDALPIRQTHFWAKEKAEFELDKDDGIDDENVRRKSKEDFPSLN